MYFTTPSAVRLAARISLFATTLSVLTAATRPNIVMFMPDDLDNTALNVALQNGLMPNLQQYIISRGTTFSNYYVSDSRGCPTRMAYLTGKYFHNLVPAASNHQCSVGSVTGGISKFNDTSTTGTWLTAAGYNTSFIGKYIDGYGYTDVNQDGVVNKADATYIPPGWANWQVFSFVFPLLNGAIPPNQILPQDNPNEYSYYINDNGTLQYYGTDPADYQADVLTTIAVQYIQTQTAGTPFYLVLAPGAPHIETNYTQTPPLTGYEAGWSWDVRPAPRYVGSVNIPLATSPNFNEGNVSDKPSWLKQIALLNADPDVTDLTVQWNDRLAALRDVDDMIGSVAAAMIANGTYENAIFVFTSDNGWFYGNHRLTGKLAAYDESVGTPLIASVGGGVTSNALVMSNDWAPTVADLAGVAIPATVDGTSFAPLLTDPSQPWRNSVLLEHWIALSGTQAVFDMPSYEAIRTSVTNPKVSNQLYVQYSTGELELYNYNNDPYALTNLAVTNPSGVQGQLSLGHKRAKALAACAGPACHATEFQ